MKTEVVISIIVALTCMVLFTTLLVQKHIGTSSYTFLVALLALICLVIPVIKRLRELDLRNLKMKLDKFEVLYKIKNLIDCLPVDTKLYDSLLRAYKDEQNMVLKKALEKDDKSLKESTEKNLMQIDLQDKIIRELTQLDEDFEQNTRKLQRCLEDINKFIASLPISFITSQKMVIEKSALLTASKAPLGYY